MSLATVICECSLNQFSTSLFVSLFVHGEPQQIIIGVNTEYRANLVEARVNVPVTLLHIYWVCQYKLFLYQKAGRGLLSCLLNLQNLHWNIIGVIINIINISNSNTVFSSLYQLVTSVSSVSLKSFVQKLPNSSELYLK